MTVPAGVTWKVDAAPASAVAVASGVAACRDSVVCASSGEQMDNNAKRQMRMVGILVWVETGPGRETEGAPR